ncbi:uncharacterized protein EDB91DRAFT_1088903 [Suillus paluster]|uniref:uncharacterized protein n=1 Tax=Suillus paluster TaxID=48578 RepID=UPI001B85DC1C|nr:uncharacterized protein EDB91DRAFT_1088903 [Suillus paluster]KAG1720225.1 hypothetical protein EDB91DRAFT_1088903 [Suillus paluster]
MSLASQLPNRICLMEGTGICSGIDKAVVPWSAIVQSQDDFVARKYLPADVDLKEPSKLQNWDTTALLNFWYARQEMGEGPTFLFKAWRKKEGNMVDSIVSKKSPPYQKCKRVMIRRPQDLSTESESDAEGNAHPDDEADVDLADSRSLQKRSRRAAGPASAHEGTAVPCSISKHHPVKPAKSGTLLTSRMGDLLAGLNAGDTGDVENAVPLLAPKSVQGKKDVIEAPARTTRSPGIKYRTPNTEAIDDRRGNIWGGLQALSNTHRVPGDR